MNIIILPKLYILNEILTLKETLELFKVISTTNLMDVELSVEEHGDKSIVEELITFVARSGMTTNLK